MPAAASDFIVLTTEYSSPALEIFLLIAWLSGIIGTSVPNSRLKGFEEAIEKGQLLMVVDVPKDRVDEIEELVHKHHSEADVRGVEPTTPPFP